MNYPPMDSARRSYRTPIWRLFARRWLSSVVCMLGILTFVCGLVGFTWQYGSLNLPPGASVETNSVSAVPAADWSIPLFKTIQLFLLNSGAEDDQDHPSNFLLTIARLSAALLFLTVSGTIVVRVLDDVRSMPRMLGQSEHIVICGLGQIGLQLLDDLHQQQRSNRVIIIENDEANPWLDYARSLGANVVIGDSTKADTLSEARVGYAKEAFVVTGDDGVNLEVVAELSLLFAKHPGRAKSLSLYVHIVDTSFAMTIQPYSKILHDTPLLVVHIFNVAKSAATRVVTEKLWQFAPQLPPQVAHFVILGFGNMGKTLALQLAQLAHFPNQKRSRFTIADGHIKQEAARFLSRFGRFTGWNPDHYGVTSFSAESDQWNWNDHQLPEQLRVCSDEAIQYVCNAEFVELPEGRCHEGFSTRLASLFADPNVKPIVFVCGQQDRENFETAVQLREQLTLLGQPNVPIFVWLPRQPALAEMLARDGDEQFVGFGECRVSASYEEITNPMRETIGMLIHQDHQWQATMPSVGSSATPWEATRDDFRESSRVAADHLAIKLSMLGFRLQRNEGTGPKPQYFESIKITDAGTLAHMEHNRWVAERLLSGWRYAPKPTDEKTMVQNNQRKSNHNLVPWDKLDRERQKDLDQIRVVLRECQQRFCVVASKPKSSS